VCAFQLHLRCGKRWARSKGLKPGRTRLILIARASRHALTRHAAPIPIAVLPLLNLNGNSADDYLAVRSQTSSFGLKGEFRDIHDAGRQLQADYILEGSVLRAGPQLRIDVQLVRVRDDFSLWSGRFDRLAADVFAIRDDISLGIVNNLRLRLGHGRRRYETSVDAYDLYLQAHATPNQRSRDQAVEAAGMYRR
jgi:TolB-like protein